MTDDDDRLEAALARALGKGADDTAPLSRAVLTRIAADSVPPRLPLAEVLALPGPATGLLLGGLLLGGPFLGGLFLGGLLLAGALGYALVPGEVEEMLLLQVLIGLGG